MTIDEMKARPNPGHLAMGWLDSEPHRAQERGQFVPKLLEETGWISGSVYYSALMLGSVDRPKWGEVTSESWGRGRPQSPFQQHLQLATDLSWSGPGQDEVIVVEGKKMIQAYSLCQTGPVCLPSIPWPASVLLLRKSDPCLQVTCPRLLC